MDTATRVLVTEPIAQSGIELLKQHFSVDVDTDLDHDRLNQVIAGYDAILIRSATKLSADVIDRATKLRVIGRAGIGVDNVDVAAATRRGIIVANAPESNIVAAAEHTIALMLSLARKIAQAHASLTSGKWERSRFSGVEVYEKTLGILGFGRIGQLVATRAQGLGMRVIAFDPYIAAERFREAGVEQVAAVEDLYARSDFLTIHLPRNPETVGFLNAQAFAQMKPGIRVINCARGELIDDDALKDALDSGKVAGAALDVFKQEPISEHPLFSYENVVVTPHLGASTTEAQDRAGTQTAEQIVAALTGGVIATAVNIPSISAEDREVIGPFIPLCERLGRLAAALLDGGTDRVEVEYRGAVAAHDTRLLTIAAVKGVLAQFTEESAVNTVNAPAIAQARGISVSDLRKDVARDFTDLVRVTVAAGDDAVRVTGTTLGHQHRPHLLEVWGQRFNLQMDDPCLALFRYEDRPGMMGRVGTILGEQGINISSAAVGRQPPGVEDGLAVMVVTTDSPIPSDLIDKIVANEGFIAGKAITFDGR